MKKVIASVAHTGKDIVLFTDMDISAGVNLLVHNVIEIDDFPSETTVAETMPETVAETPPETVAETPPETVAETMPETVAVTKNIDLSILELLALDENKAKGLSTTPENDGIITIT